MKWLQEGQPLIKEVESALSGSVQRRPCPKQIPLESPDPSQLDAARADRRLFVLLADRVTGSSNVYRLPSPHNAPGMCSQRSQYLQIQLWHLPPETMMHHRPWQSDTGTMSVHKKKKYADATITTDFNQWKTQRRPSLTPDCSYMPSKNVCTAIWIRLELCTRQGWVQGAGAPQGSDGWPFTAKRANDASLQWGGSSGLMMAWKKKKATLCTVHDPALMKKTTTYI